MVASVGLASPWGVISVSGIVVRAHGNQTGQDTTSYSVDFTSLVPASGSLTAYLVASLMQIQQNPFPLTGPPQGHPSYNPNFVPSVAYAANTYTVALNAVTGGVDNVSIFELARTTLVPSQTQLSTFSVIGWQRAAPRTPLPPTLTSTGGILSLTAATALLMPTVPGLTSTLPTVASGGGLVYTVVNPTTGAWSVVAGTGNTLTGGTVAPATSMTIPPYGAAWFWGNAPSGVWEMIAANPVMMASLPNVFTATQTVSTTGTVQLAVTGTGSSGATIELLGNGSTTPNKYLSAVNGILQAKNSANTTAILTLDDTGDLSITGQASAGSLSISGSGAVSNGFTATNGLGASAFDAGGMNFRTYYGTSPAAGFRNDGSYFYLLLSNTGNPLGAYNAFRPFYVNLTTGALTIDNTGAGVSFGGLASAYNLFSDLASIGGVSFPGGGTVNTPGAITAGGQILGGTVQSTAGSITANGGRLRAGLGAFNSGDQNAATLLSDFFLDISAGYFYQRLPNGFIFQGYNGTSTTGEDIIPFPIAFPTQCISVIAQEANPGGGWTVGQVTNYSAELLTPTQFTLFSFKYVNPYWEPSAGLGYRYMAYGN